MLYIGLSSSEVVYIVQIVFCLKSMGRDDVIFD